MKATTTGSILNIPQITLPGGGKSAASAIDLTPYQGRSVRIYINSGGQVEINPTGDSYWQVAEIDLPPAQSETIQTGTRNEIIADPIMSVRGNSTVDTVPLAANQQIGSVGFDWATYRENTDYKIQGGDIAWVPGGREPAVGEPYQVVILSTNTVPVTTQRALPLDLAQHSVTFFDLP